MDMLPPDPATAAVHSPTRTATIAAGALQSLAAVHASLRELETSAPVLPDALPRSADSVLGSLDAYWATQSFALERAFAATLRDEATLRVEDGTLDAKAGHVAHRVMDSSGAPGVHTREVLLDGKPVAGAIVADSDDAKGHYVLFLADKGWETYPSLDMLTEHVRRHLAMPAAVVTLRTLGAGAVTTLTAGVIQAQRDHIAMAWDDFNAENGTADAATRLADRLRDYLAISHYLDIASILQQRESRLLALAQAERLSHAPHKVADAWRKAVAAYETLAFDAAALRVAAGIKPAESPAMFTDRELAARLQANGISDAPGDLVVEVTHDPAAGSYEQIKAWMGGKTVVRQPLRELAWRGVSAADPVRLKLLRADGASMNKAPGESTLLRILRATNVAQRYRAHLETRLRNGQRGSLARAIDIELRGARMRAEAEEARLAYYLDDEPRSFRDDHAERGFRWVNVALERRTATGREKVEGHDVVVRQLTYKGVPLRDVLLFGASRAESVPSVVVYSPGAPDGRTFREFDDRQSAARDFLYAPAFREYLLDRLPGAFAEADASGMARRFSGDRLANWVLGASSTASYTATEEPFEEREVAGDFLAATYDAMVDQKIHDAHSLERDARRWSFSWVGTHPVYGLLADAAWETLRAPARTLAALNRFYDHVKAGDHVESLVAFTDAYTSALDIFVPPWVAGKAHVPLIRHAPGKPAARASFALTMPVQSFEARYAAPGVVLRGTPDAHGVHTVQGHQYIRQEGRVFAVRYDATFDTWRLQPPQAGPTAWGPAIHEVESGAWVYNEVGLRGGAGRRLRERLRRVLHLGEDMPAPPAPPPIVPVAEQAAPARQPTLRLPAELEPQRAEFEAVFRDNPGAELLTRRGSTDSLHVRLQVPSRTAFVAGESTALELRSLDGAQLDQLLIELRARFPDAEERGRVLSARGWARDGHRLPSPGRQRWHGDDGQDPVITSSTDAPGEPAFRLSADQQRRWDESVAAARAYAGEPGTSAAAANPTQALRGAAEMIDATDWPRDLWIYVNHPVQQSGRRGGEIIVRSGHEGSLHVFNRFQATTLPPNTPTAHLDSVLGVSPAQRLGGHDPLAHWVRVDGRYMADPLHRPNHQLVRRLLPDGEYAYTVHTWGPELRLPATYTRLSPSMN